MTHRFLTNTQLSIVRSDEAYTRLSKGLRYPHTGGEKENLKASSVRQTFPYLPQTISLPSLVRPVRMFKDVLSRTTADSNELRFADNGKSGVKHGRYPSEAERTYAKNTRSSLLHRELCV